MIEGESVGEPRLQCEGIGRSSAIHADLEDQWLTFDHCLGGYRVHGERLRSLRCMEMVRERGRLVLRVGDGDHWCGRPRDGGRS